MFRVQQKTRNRLFSIYDLVTQKWTAHVVSLQEIAEGAYAQSEGHCYLFLPVVGQRDKQQEEILEGSILQWDQAKYIVVWDEIMLCWYGHTIEKYTHHLRPELFSKSCIVGNIYVK